MNKFEILSNVLDYIEENLTEGAAPEGCAEKCCYSLSNLQKMFRCTFHMGVSDYISRRRLTRAAGELIRTDDPILDIALRYGYNSHETFTRAFTRLWGVTPSQFRKECSFSEIFPRLAEPRQVFDERGNTVMTSHNFDVSNLYDYIASRRGCYAVCFDMVKLMYINDTYGNPAGDLAIAKCLRDIDEAADDTMLTIRIGGDEFVLITAYKTKEEAEKVTEKILSHNGETVRSGDTDIPVSMRAGYAVIPEKGNLRYNSLFDSFIVAGRGESNS